MQDPIERPPLQNPGFRSPGFVHQHGVFLIRLSRLVDVVLIILSLALADAATHAVWGRQDLVLSVLAAALFQMTTSMFDFYRSWRVIRLRYEVARLLTHWVIAVLLVGPLTTFAGWEPARLQVLYLWFAFGAASMIAVRIAFRMLLRHLRAVGYDHRRVAFAGCTTVAKQMSGIFADHPWMGIDVAGFYDDRAPGGKRTLATATRNGDFAQLASLAREGGIQAVYICLPMGAEGRIKKLVDALSNTTVSIYYCPSFVGFDLLNARWDDVFGQPVVSIVESPFVGYQRLVKRFEDMLLVTIVLPLVALPMLIVALAIALTSPGPVFFRQSRYGLDGKPFRIWKFRTMYNVERDEEFRQATRNDARVTPLGRLLRRTSVDELPQIFNVILGDMSFVGPRPHPVKLDETHRDDIHRYMVRHKVKPGITGLAQVSGCRGETFDRRRMSRRIEHDLMYIRSWSVWLDLKILARTVSTVMSREDAH